MTIAECQVETMKHIEKVRKYIRFFTDKLTCENVAKTIVFKQKTAILSKNRRFL